MSSGDTQLPTSRPTPINRLTHAWMALTSHEQRAALLILGLFLLGVISRYWHVVLKP